MLKRIQQLNGFILGIFLFTGAILPVTVFTQDYDDSRFGFLSVYGQGRPTQYKIWDEEFGLDLIAESSILAKDLSIGWTRLSFFYPLNPDNYTQQKFDQAKKDGLEVFATVIIEESDFDEINYSEWLEEIISKYSSDVKYWQIHNEVGKTDIYENPDDYLELVKVTSSVIKESCADCIIVMGSTIPNEEYYDEVIQKGDSYVDAYDFHIFSEDGIDAFKKFEIKITKPIFITEMSTYSGKPLGRQTFTYQTEKQQAEILIKWNTQSFYHGADHIFWSQFIEWYKFGGQVDGFFDFTGIVYNGMCDCPDPNNICDDLSIDKGALVKKEAYYSLKTLIDKIDEFSSVEKINEGQFKFKVDEKDVYVLWCDSGSCSLPSEITGEVKVTDYLGDEKTMSLSQIILGKSPVFVEEISNTSIKETGGNTPNKFQLNQNYPNPFNPQTTISYQLPVCSNVTLKIYDVLGKEVRTLVNENKPAGEYSVVWNGVDNLGRRVSSGVYFYQLKVDNNLSQMKKLLLLK